MIDADDQGRDPEHQGANWRAYRLASRIENLRRMALPEREEAELPDRQRTTRSISLPMIGEHSASRKPGIGVRCSSRISTRISPAAEVAKFRWSSRPRNRKGRVSISPPS